MENEIFMTKWNGHDESIKIMRCKWMNHKWIVADEWMPMDECRWVKWGKI